MNTFVGKCVGGPWDGQMLAHTTRTKPLLRPVGEFFGPGCIINAHIIGEYRLNNFDQWHWWPTEEGKAIDILFGP